MIDSLVNLYDDFTKRGRVEDLQQLSREYGFDFEKRGSFGAMPTELKAFRIFKQKGSKRLLGVMHQEAEHFKGNLRCYEYLRTRDLETKYQTIIEIFCDEIYTDPVVIEPKSAFGKMKGFLVSGNRQFPNLDNFYQNFEISSPREEDTLWLNEKALDMMSDFPGMTMEAAGNYFLFYIKKKEMKVQDIMPRLEFAEEFVRLTCFDRSADYV